jgi:hypothetical protein
VSFRVDSTTIAKYQMRYQEIDEGRVYRVDWGYPSPVMIISNPSSAQARTLIELLRKKHSMMIYLRGLMIDHTVYVWDGHSMTHHDVFSELLSDVYTDSDDVCTFEIADYTVIGFAKIRQHAAKCTILKMGHDPSASSFVKNVMAAIDATLPDESSPASS